MIERFTIEQFEAALPKSEKFPIKSEGMINGEYCWSMAVGKVKILIRSSIDSSKVSADTGEDSIRVFLVDEYNRPMGSKLNRWTTRKIGWEERVKQLLRQFVKLCLASGADQGGIKIFKCKQGENKGRLFCKRGDNFIAWLTDSKGELL